MKAVVAAFNQEKALVGAGAFSVITNLWMEIFEALIERCPRVGHRVVTTGTTDHWLQ